MAKEPPNQPAPKPIKEYFSIFKEKDTWYFCILYSVTFGGFVGLASFLSYFFSTQYGVSGVRAGDFVTLVVAAGSFLRSVGGMIADKIGGVRLLQFLLIGVAICMFAVSLLPPLAFVTVALFLGMGCLGMGNGAIFQLVPQRFQKEIGMVTGVVGAAGFITFSLVALIALGLLVFAQVGWRKQWKLSGKSVRI